SPGDGVADRPCPSYVGGEKRPPRFLSENFGVKAERYAKQTQRAAIIDHLRFLCVNLRPVWGRKFGTTVTVSRIRESGVDRVTRRDYKEKRPVGCSRQVVPQSRSEVPGIGMPSARAWSPQGIPAMRTCDQGMRPPREGQEPSFVQVFSPLLR